MGRGKDLLQVPLKFVMLLVLTKCNQIKHFLHFVVTFSVDDLVSVQHEQALQTFVQLLVLQS